MKLIFALGTVLVLTSGCAATGKQLVEKGARSLESVPSCCPTLATAKIIPLPVSERVGDTVQVEINEERQVFNFGGNKAYFVLYALPEFSSAYSITLSSLALGVVSDRALFLPRVAIYDSNFKPTRFFEEKTLRNRGNNVERTVFFNPVNANERYLAIFGSDLSSSIERSYSEVTATPVFIGPVVFNLISGYDAKSTIRSSPIGTISISTNDLVVGTKK
jgi:hypothetical protein